MIIDLKEQGLANAERKILEYMRKNPSKTIEVRIVPKTMSDRQRRALHLWFNLMATALQEAGIDMQALLEGGVSVPVTKEALKEFWKGVMAEQLGITSTTQMETGDVDAIYETVNRHIAEKTGIHIAFPNWDYASYKY